MFIVMDAISILATRWQVSHSDGYLDFNSVKVILFSLCVRGQIHFSFRGHICSGLCALTQTNTHSHSDWVITRWNSTVFSLFFPHSSLFLPLLHQKPTIWAIIHSSSLFLQQIIHFINTPPVSQVTHPVCACWSAKFCLIHGVAPNLVCKALTSSLGNTVSKRYPWLIDRPMQGTPCRKLFQPPPCDFHMLPWHPGTSKSQCCGAFCGELRNGFTVKKWKDLWSSKVMHFWNLLLRRISWMTVNTLSLLKFLFHCEWNIHSDF